MSDSKESDALKTKVLILHNIYRTRGGEERAVELHCRALDRSLHIKYDVLMVDSAKIDSPVLKVRAGVNAVHNGQMYHMVRNMVRESNIDIVHIHNFWPVLSPSVIKAATQGGARVVMTLHNARSACINGLLTRNGHDCDLCLSSRTGWPGLAFNCREKLSESVLYTAVRARFRSMQNQVDLFLTPSTYMARQMELYGLRQVRVLRNYVPESTEKAVPMASTKFIFVGRISKEKGIDVLLNAWNLVNKRSGFALHIIGDGPDMQEMQGRYRDLKNVSWRGRLSRGDVDAEMRTARALILPSVVRENFPYALIEALAIGLPIVGTDSGGIAEIARPISNDVVFAAGDHVGLSSILQRMLDSDEWISALAESCVEQFHQQFSEEEYRRSLEQVYCDLVSRSVN